MLCNLLWTNVAVIKSVVFPFDLLKATHIQYDNTSIWSDEKVDLYEELWAFLISFESFTSLKVYWWFGLFEIKGIFSSRLKIDQICFMNLISQILSDNSFPSAFMNHRLYISHVNLCVCVSPLTLWSENKSADKSFCVLLIRLKRIKRAVLFFLLNNM